MATTTLQYPFATLQGSIHPSDDIYVRHYGNKLIFQHKPRSASPRQQQMRHAFALRYAGAHPKQSGKPPSNQSP